MTNSHSDDEIIAVTLKTLEQQPSPVPVSRLVNELLPRSHRPKREHLAALCEGCVGDGRLHRYSPRRLGAPRYHVLDPKAYARQLILSLVTTPSGDVGPYTQPALTKKIAEKLAGDCTRGDVEQALRQLVAEQQVLELAPFPPAKSVRILSNPPRLEDCFADVISLSRRRLADLEAKGLVWGEALEAFVGQLRGLRTQVPGDGAALVVPEGQDNDESILDAMRQLEPKGGVVSIRELRQALRTTFPDKQAFDQALLRLFKDYIVDLHVHDSPLRESQEVRDAMVTDGEGRYYPGVALRGE